MAVSTETVTLMEVEDGLFAGKQRRLVPADAVYLASEVDPLLTALAEANNARAQLQQVVSDKSVEIKDLRALLAERAQEIERLKGAAESDAEEYIKAVQVVGEMTEQIHALTARAEAAEAENARLRAQLEGKG